MTKLKTDTDLTQSEIAFVTESLSKVKNPKHRYFLTLTFDLLADALSEREELTLPELLEFGKAATQ